MRLVLICPRSRRNFAKQRLNHSNDETFFVEIERIETNTNIRGVKVVAKQCSSFLATLFFACISSLTASPTAV